MELKLFLEYLKNTCTNQEIADSLGISRTTVIRFRKQLGLNETPIDSKRLKELDTYSEEKLRELVYKKKNRLPPEKDFLRILDELKYPNSSLKSVYTKLNENEKDLKTTSLGYVWFTKLIKSYFKRKDISDRNIFKPWQYLEIGRLEVRRHAFLYAYLPYSRYVIFSRPIRESDPTHAATFLFQYLYLIGGVPEKIICSEKGKALTGREDNRLLYDLLYNLNRLLLVKRIRCVFQEKEKELVSAIQGIKTVRDSGDLFVKISSLANGHNTKLDAYNLVREETVLNGKGIIPEDVHIPFRGTYKVDRLNGHVKFNDVWYSCPYMYAGRQVKLTVKNNYLVILDPEKSDVEIASHELFKLTDRPSRYVKKYSTLPGHTPHSLADWDASPLQCTSYYIDKAQLIGPTFTNIVIDYLEKVGPKGTRLLLYVMSEKDKTIEAKAIQHIKDKKELKDFIYELAGNQNGNVSSSKAQKQLPSNDEMNKFDNETNDEHNDVSINEFNGPDNIEDNNETMNQINDPDEQYDEFEEDHVQGVTHIQEDNSFSESDDLDDFPF